MSNDWGFSNVIGDHDPVPAQFAPRALRIGDDANEINDSSAPWGHQE